MQVWAVIAQKGGQSKTTLSTGFAVEAAREGASVVILDADDRQGSALYWSERRDDDDVTVKDSSVAGLAASRLARARQRQDRPYHHRHAGELQRHCHARSRAGGFRHNTRRPRAGWTFIRCCRPSSRCSRPAPPSPSF